MYECTCELSRARRVEFTRASNQCLEVCNLQVYMCAVRVNCTYMYVRVRFVRCVNDIHVHVRLVVHACHSHSFVNLWLTGTVLSSTIVLIFRLWLMK